MYNHVLRCHSHEDKVANFEKPSQQQNPFFGIEPAFEDLQPILNSIRYLSRVLLFDEELIFMLGRAPIISFIKDKRNRYGAKLFMMCGSNEGGKQKGYLHYGKLYRGKSRERSTAFSGHGKGYENVMNGILAMKLRYMGYWIMMDSWFSGLTLFLHGRYWGVNMAGTFRENRKGLDSKKSYVCRFEKRTEEKVKPKKENRVYQGCLGAPISAELRSCGFSCKGLKGIYGGDKRHRKSRSWIFHKMEP